MILELPHLRCDIKVPGAELTLVPSDVVVEGFLKDRRLPIVMVVKWLSSTHRSGGGAWRFELSP